MVHGSVWMDTCLSRKKVKNRKRVRFPYEPHNIGLVALAAKSPDC